MKLSAFSTLLCCLLLTSLSFAQQTLNSSQLGNCNFNPGLSDPNNPNNSSNLHTLPPSPQNGNGTLGQTFNMVKCGLNYVQTSRKLGQRFYASCCPSTNGIVQPAAFPISGIPNCAVIERAYLWYDCSGNNATTFTTTIVNPLNVTQNFPMTMIGSGIDKCWGAQGTYTYRADVTSIISGNGTYTISGIPTSGYPINGSDADGATLMIIYSNPTATYRGHLVIHDGTVVVNGGSTTQTITGINACAASTFAQSFIILADLQGSGANTTLNGTPYNHPGAQDDWWNFISTNTTVANAQATSNYFVNSGTCYNFCVAGLYYQTNTCVTCPSSSSGLTVTSSTVPATCSQCNGSATVNVTGGTAPYTYSWNTTPVQTTATATGLCAGTYTVFITDATGCNTAQATVTVTTNSSALTVTNSAQSNVLCFGQCNGSATVNVTGGTSPYTYNWSPSGGTAATGTGLCAGTYTVNVTDAGGCTGTQTVTITQPTLLNATSSLTNALCNGVCNGTAGVVVSGGTPGYTYNWTPSGGTNATATGLCAGGYTVTITDANGCTITRTFIINQPPAIVLNTSVVGASCNQSNGSATVTASGGTPNYTYNWAPSGGTNATANNLGAGSYTVTVTDANGCTATATVVIPSSAGPSASISTSANVTCFGACNGTATVTVTGGTNPITYAWSPSGGNAATASGLCAGNYTCLVTDANGCTSTATVTITEPTQLTLAVAGFNASCNGSCDGQGVCIPSGGTPNYTFSWAPSGGTNPSATGLCAGTYTVYVTDQNGCTANDTAIVNQPAPMVIATSSTTSNCGQPDGSACANVSGGNPPYTYQWSPSNQTGNCAVNIGPGTYTVTVTDFNGCTQTATVVVLSTPGVNASISASANATCAGACDGSATVTASGGTPPYTYAWSSGGNAPTENGLCAGTYTCVITDPFGCSATATITITEPTAVTVGTTQVNVLCNGACTGSSTASASGGTGPYTYAWSNLQNTQTSTGLCAGTYTVTATDANGCTGQTTVTITEPTAVGVTAVAAPAIICVGSSSTLTATGSGGTAPYTFAWAPNGSGSSINVTPTTTTIYTVTVTDANGCTANNTVTVTVNPLPVVSFTSNPTPAVGCAPLCVDFSSTTPNSVSCAWDFTIGTASTCSTNFCFNNPGSYDVTLTVTDNNGCVNTLTLPAYVTVYPNPVADFSMSPQPTSILNGTITFTDLSQGNPNQWQWSFGDVLNSSSTQQNPQFMYTDSGNYVVTLIVTTQYGCVDSISKTLRIEPDYTIYVPNAFTPNGDNDNETFFPKGSGIDETKFKMWIFDRWGNMIWYTEKWGKGWDGRANDGKDIAQEDVYVWKIEIYDFLGAKHQYVGHVSLIK